MPCQTIKDVQKKILEIAKFIDKICRNNGIVYYIMGGTALGAVRHGGFIPWDDDLDIFMTPENYKKFKKAFFQIKNDIFVLQEWKIDSDYLEYAKIRMNKTTFIEKNFKDRKNMHHGIYIDIMILHKCPTNKIMQKTIYYISKYVTLLALSQRNWKAKRPAQELAMGLLYFLPNKFIARLCYKRIYKYDSLTNNFAYCYFITSANFKQGIFDKSIFEKPVDIPFEDTLLMAPKNIKKYLEIRYGNYMRLPSKEQQTASVHADIYDTTVGFEKYI